MSAVRGLGSLSTWYAELIARQFIPFGAGTWALYVERTATLSDDLSEVNDRSLRYFRLVGHETDLHISRDMAVWLQQALEKALRETEGEDVIR